MLIIACGKTKVKSARPVQAHRLYTGGVFRKMLSVAVTLDPDVRILSAGYGLLRLNDMVLPYDVKMDAHRAAEFKQLGLVQGSGSHLLPRTYAAALPPWFTALLPPGLPVGKMLQAAGRLKKPRLLVNVVALKDGKSRRLLEL